MNRMVDSGKDASTPKEFVQCATTRGGVVNTTILLGKLSESHMDPEQTISGITDFNHFEFNETGMKMQKHSLIGEGIEVKLDKVKMAQKFEYQIWPENQEGLTQKRTLKMYKKPGTTDFIAESDESVDNINNVLPEEDEPSDQRSQYDCPNELCDQTFQTYSEREQHFHQGGCSLTILETVSKMWTSEYSASTFQTLTPQQKRSIQTLLTPLQSARVIETVPRGVLDLVSEFIQGWAIRVRKKPTKFTTDQEKFVKAAFDQGEISKNRKVQPEEVVANMRRAKTNEGTYKFSKKDWLTEQQVIHNMISCLFYGLKLCAYF